MTEQAQDNAWKAWVSGLDDRLFETFPEVFAEIAFKAGWQAAKEDERRKPDPLGEALNSGDGSYRP